MRNVRAETIGYGRVQPGTSIPSRSRTHWRRADCEQVFIDLASGKLAHRPELDAALRSARTGDQLVVTKLDRLGRSLEHLIELANVLQRERIALVVLDQGIDTSTAVGRMSFQILEAIAEFEHSLMGERTRDGLAAARARGRTGGRKAKLGARQVRLAREMYDQVDYQGRNRYTVAEIAAEIAAEFGVNRPTIYRYLDVDTPVPAGR
ncbi:recombinase family protein [Nakamurella leprariae]|uniref:Recombinase family protein n=1 Tax=Nakamurella leprariae TaxID=2803911 RepID=A0A939BYD3_9ACTN|nr:recombinase family protein [Nakamurella leprariae]MBM9466975.1 recombinase family protein [Nakamurella leprariae]